MAKYLFGLIMAAVVAVILSISTSVSADGCPPTNARSLADCNRKCGTNCAPVNTSACRSTCIEKFGEKKKVPRPKDTDDKKNEPCPYYMGERKADCPAGCPDKKMSIKGITCKCPTGMKLSKNNTSCKCPKGKVLIGKKCVKAEAVVDCGTCRETVKELISQTRFCASGQKWYFSEEDYLNNCGNCPDGTLDTGWECIQLPEAMITDEWDFFDLRPTIWDLIPWLLIIILFIILLRRKRDIKNQVTQVLRRRLDEAVAVFNKSVVSPLRSEFKEKLVKIPANWKKTRLSDLENIIIPFLQLRLVEAEANVNKSKSELEDFGSMDIDEDEKIRSSLAPTIIAEDSDPHEKATVGLDEVDTRFEPRLMILQRSVDDAKKTIREIEKQITERKKEARSLRSS